MLLSALALTVFMAACTDDRQPPVAPEENSYNETKTLFSQVSVSGQDISRSFTLRDSIVNGRLYITCELMPDSDLANHDNYAMDIDTLSDTNADLDVLIINLELQAILTHEDSLLLVNLRTLKQTNLDSIAYFAALIDSLDTYLDDRFSVSVWLDSDTVEYYPQAIFLSSAAEPYLGAETTVWGQGFFLMPPSPEDSIVFYTDTLWYAGDSLIADPAVADTFEVYNAAIKEIIRRGYRGKTLTLDLNEFWVADAFDISGPYYHPAKPERATRYTDQYPVRDWIGRLNNGSQHTLYVRFGGAGLDCRVTASFYVTYSSEG
jgi:hypothetical protein